MPRRLSIPFAAVLVCALLVTACSGDEPRPTATPTSTATAEPTPTVEQTAVATSTPRGTTTTPIGREPLYPRLSESAPGELPEGVSLFVLEGCYACDGPPTALLRVGADGDMVRVVEDDETAPYIHDAFTSGGTLYYFECTTGYCGSLGGSEGQPASMTLYRSRDRGDTFESLGEIEGVSDDPAEWDVDAVNPAALLDRSGADVGQFVYEGITLDVAAIDPRGDSPDDGPAYSMGAPARRGGYLAASWSARGDGSIQYVTIFRDDGVPLATYAGVVLAVAWLDDSRLVVTLDNAAGPMPAILEVFSGVVHPLIDPFADTPGRNFVVGVIAESEG